MTFDLSCRSSSLQENISDSDIDDSFRSMFAQLSGDVSFQRESETATASVILYIYMKLNYSKLTLTTDKTCFCQAAGQFPRELQPCGAFQDPQKWWKRCSTIFSLQDMEISVRELRTILNRVVSKREFWSLSLWVTSQNIYIHGYGGPGVYHLPRIGCISNPDESSPFLAASDFWFLSKNGENAPNNPEEILRVLLWGAVMWPVRSMKNCSIFCRVWFAAESKVV